MERTNIIITTTIMCIILWYFILYLCRNKFIYPIPSNIVSLLFILPVIFIIYHGITEMEYFKQIKDLEKEKKQILEAFNREKDLANIIPVIIFGFGFLIMNNMVRKKISKLVIPFLIMSLLLGTVVPYTVIYNSFDNCSNEKILISEIVLFSSEAVALSMLISCCIMTFFMV